MSPAGPDLRVAALGEAVRVGGYALAGAVVLDADTPAAVEQAWRSLPVDVGLVLLTPAAADVLGGALAEAQRTRPDVLTAVLP